MTNLEAVLEDLQPYPVRLSLIRRKCIQYGLVPDSRVSDEKKVAKIVVEILVQMLSLNNVSEGGVTISFNREGVEAYIKALCSSYGFDSDDYINEPTVKYLGDL